MKRPTSAVLLAAGRGERLRPHTDRVPKPLLAVNGRPTLDFVLDAARRAGIQRVCLVTYHLEEQIRAYAGDGSAWGLQVDYCRQEELRGNVGHALGLRFERAAARAKVAWKRNGFRHSYISYRVATLKDVPAVALECGNSPQVIFSNYRALATDAEAKAWFSILPPTRG